MKWMKLAVVIASATAFGRAYAFHEGGVAYCDGCHSMHNSSGNAAMSGGRNTGLTGWGKNAAGVASSVSTTPFQGNNFLLQGSDNSSTCLNCHAAADSAPTSYHIMTFGNATATAPVERTPGGDFGWLKITTSATASYGAPVSNPGDRHGHNVIAADYGLGVDGKLTVAPGGQYAANALSCASCHDPHSRARIDSTGKIVYPAFGSAVASIGGSGSYGATPTADEAVGVYRLLGGKNYSQMSYTNPLPFNADPPVAVAPATYNQSEATNQVHVAYGQGMSEWCANCHRSIHNDTTNTANTALIHPAGNGAKLSAAANDLAGNATGTTIAAIYNAYKKSGDLTGSSTTSYASLVPFEEGTGDLATLASHASNDGSTTAGPGADANVMCLSCHRAHASGWSSMTRWNNKAEFLTVGGVYPGKDQTGEAAYGQLTLGYTQAQYAAAMYDQPATNFAYAQRSLCNKCHAKD